MSKTYRGLLLNEDGDEIYECTFSSSEVMTVNSLLTELVDHYIEENSGNYGFKISQNSNGSWEIMLLDDDEETGITIQFNPNTPLSSNLLDLKSELLAEYAVYMCQNFGATIYSEKPDKKKR